MLAATIKRGKAHPYRPIADARLYILDDRRRPVPLGVPGELWIGGSGVVPGYLNDAALTSDRFVPGPFTADPASRLYSTAAAIGRAGCQAVRSNSSDQIVATAKQIAAVLRVDDPAVERAV
jgi:non-ribosomal peptide synthetase component F